MKEKRMKEKRICFFLTANCEPSTVNFSKEAYEKLIKAGIEVLWDDREDLSAGEKFADADLIGIPLRLVLSEKTLAEGSVEWKRREEKEAHLVSLQDIIEQVEVFVKE